MLIERSIKAFIFDIGGVLVGDTNKTFLPRAAKILKASPAKIQKVIREEEPELQLGQIAELEFWHKVCQKLKIIPPSNKILRTLLADQYKTDAPINSKVMIILEKLHKKYPMAAISNTIKAHTVVNNKRQLYTKFDFVLISHEVHARKPQEKIFTLAARRLQLPKKNILFVDDEQRFVKQARAYGFPALQFHSASQLSLSLKRKKLL